MSLALALALALLLAEEGDIMALLVTPLPIGGEKKEDCKERKLPDLASQTKGNSRVLKNKFSGIV